MRAGHHTAYEPVNDSFPRAGCVPNGSVSCYHQCMASPKQIRVYTKTNRAPATGEMIGVRLQPDLLALLDAERARHDPEPSRPEMVRRLLAAALSRSGT